ncbi:MAG: hypothetical protein ACOYK6_06250 [Chthoniobacterales bacterium]
MAISPTSNNIAVQSTQNTSYVKSNPNSLNLGKNNGSINRANAADQQQSAAPVNNTPIVQVADSQKVGLNPGNAV